MSMPRLSKYDEAAMQRELESKRREYELMMEVERLRYERSMAEEGARQSIARARLEFESERLRTAQDRLEQLSVVGGVASSDGSAALTTPTKFGPLDSSTVDMVDKPAVMPRRVDRRSAGLPPAGAEKADV